MLCAAVQALHPAVFDTNGRELSINAVYHIESPFAGGGSVTLARNRSKICPLNVVKQPFFGGPDEDFPPIPDNLAVTFHPLNTSDTVVRVSTALNIKFAYRSPCPESTVWRVDPSSDGSADYGFITSGVDIGNPGCETRFNWFKVKHMKNSFSKYVYKLVYNPNAVCSSYRNFNVIQSFYHDGYYPLAVHHDNTMEFEVIFVDATPINSVQAS